MKWKKRVESARGRLVRIIVHPSVNLSPRLLCRFSLLLACHRSPSRRLATGKDSTLSELSAGRGPRRRAQRRRRGAKVKLQSEADPGNTGPVTCDDDHRVWSARSEQGLSKGSGGTWQVDSDESLISDGGCWG